ncbi:hypothetical protein G7Y79_00017g043350 [Physcia stellaris]|nr:hypothetical protein G7Y79_00017g043350 [Physcia stellaris]
MVSGVQEATGRLIESQTPNNQQPSTRGLITASTTNRLPFGNEWTRRASNRVPDTPFSFLPSMSGENHSTLDRKSREKSQPISRNLRYSAIFNTHADSVQTPPENWSPAALSIKSTFEDSPFASTSSNFSGDSAFDDSQFASSEHLSGDSAPRTATTSYFPVNSMIGIPQLGNFEDPLIDDRASDIEDDKPSSHSPYWKAQMQNPTTRASCIRKLREEKPRKRNTKKKPEEIEVDPRAKDKVSKTKRNTQHARNSRQKKQTYIEMMQAYFEWSQSYINECETVKEEQHQIIAQLQQTSASGKAPLMNVPAPAQPTFGHDWTMYTGNSDPIRVIKQEQEQETVDLRSDTPLPHFPRGNLFQLNQGAGNPAGYKYDDQAPRNDARMQQVRQRQQFHQDMRLLNVGHEDHNQHLRDDLAASAPRTDLRHLVSARRRASDEARAELIDPQLLARENQTYHDIEGSAWSQHPACLDHTISSHNPSNIGGYEHNIAFPEYEGGTIFMSQSAAGMDPTKPPSHRRSVASGSKTPMPENPGHHEQDLPYQSIEGGDGLPAADDTTAYRGRSWSSELRSMENLPEFAQCSESEIQQEGQSLLEDFEIPGLDLSLGEERDPGGDGEHTQRL